MPAGDSGVSRQDVVRHAEAYPFDLPEGSYLFGAVPGHRTDLEDRVPVLALGSNAAPSQLARKFPRLDAPIPVARAVLQDHAVVYSAHFSKYGSLPASLTRLEGALAYVFVTWLTPTQLLRMHETEGVGDRYDYRETELPITVEEVGALPRVGVYLGRAGPLQVAGRPVRIAEVPTIRCPLPALTQPAALRLAHRRLASHLPFEEFITRLAGDEIYRREMSARLRELDTAPA